MRTPKPVWRVIVCLDRYRIQRRCWFGWHTIYPFEYTTADEAYDHICRIVRTERMVPSKWTAVREFYPDDLP